MNKSEKYCKTLFYGIESELSNFISTNKFDIPESRLHFVPDHSTEPEHVEIKIEFDFDKEEVKTTTTFNLVVKNEFINKISLDAKNLTIHEVIIDGEGQNFENTGKKLNIFIKEPIKRGLKFGLQIFSSVEKPKAGVYFVKPTPEYPQKHMHVWTQCQDEDASFIFPCFDHPSFKQTSEVIINKVPKDMIALSNGSLIEKSDSMYHYKFDVPHSIYLISVVVGHFKEISDSWDGIPVSFYVHPSRVEDGHRAFDITKKIVQFYSEFTGFRYPYHKYSQIAVSDFIFGGMENTTVTTQTDLTLHDKRAHLDFSSNGLVAHELAHQWFGDLLTCKEWAHAWLNESFATYFQALFFEFDLGKDEFDYEMLNKAETYFNEDSSKYSRPIVYNKYAEPIDLFDSHLYPGGAWRLNMLREMFGTEEFKRVINYYIEQNKYNNVETIDLQRAFEKVTGTNVDSFFDQWLYKSGYPVIEFEYSWKEKENLLEMHIHQTQNTDEIQIFKFKANIKIVFENNKTNTIIVDVKEKNQSIYLYLDEKPSFVSFDNNNAILKKLSIKTQPQFLKNQMTNDSEVIGRIYAIQSFAKEPTLEKINFLGERLKNEQFWGVKARIAQTLGSNGSFDAENILIAALSEPHPKARRAIVKALQSFPNSTNSAEALASILKNSDSSYFVESEACKSLGALKIESFFDLLTKQLEKDSHSDVIRQGALEGLSFLQTNESFSTILEWTKIGRSTQARTTAIVSLAKLGKLMKPDITFEHLAMLSQENNFRIKIATIVAFRILSNKKALSYLTKYQETEADGRIKKIAYTAKLAIQKELERPQELDLLKEEIGKLQEENRRMKDSINKLLAK